MFRKMSKNGKTSLLLLAIALLVAIFAACANNADDNDHDVYTPEVVATPEPAEYPVIDDTPDLTDDTEEQDEVYKVIMLGSEITGAIHRIEYGDNVAYLFGTMHVSLEHWFPLADVVEDALRRADVVAVEVAELALDPEIMFEALTEFLILPDGQTWAEFLPEDAYSHLVSLLPEWGMNYLFVNTLNPAFFVYSLTLGLMIGIADPAISFEFSVDSYITVTAQELGLPIIGLESLQQQSEILFNPPFDVMLAMIMDLASPEEMVENIIESDELLIDELVYLYERNDFQAMNDSFARTLDIESDDPFVIYTREVVSNWRSTYYANEIARLLRETSDSTTFFVAVGLTHVNRSGAGEGFTDIVEQLELAGFTAVPLWR